MHSNIFAGKNIDPEIVKFYCTVVAALNSSGIRFLAGGAFAMRFYTGIVRNTKDFDVFVHPNDVVKTLEVLNAAGYKTELTDKVWLGKAFYKDNLVDVIFSSANGLVKVDEDWFTYARQGKFFDFDIKIVPPEEMIWSKAFIMTRDRFDGGDISHLLLYNAPFMNWQRLLQRFDEHWPLLYNYLILFAYIYPHEKRKIPRSIMRELSNRLVRELKKEAGDLLCRGPLLSTTDYVVDIEKWGYISPLEESYGNNYQKSLKKNTKTRPRRNI